MIGERCDNARNPQSVFLAVIIIEGYLSTPHPKAQWHPAFCSAMELEFRFNKEDLTFLPEWNLGRKPFQIDLMVIKKSNTVRLRNRIGKHFKTYNLIEYKSPDDELNIDTFYKGYGCACLFKASARRVDEYRLEDITLTFVRWRKPVKLIRQLPEHGYEIHREISGIYHIR